MTYSRRMNLVLVVLGWMIVNTAVAIETAAQSKSAEPADKPEIKEYVVGVVPQFSTRKIQSIWQPLLEKVSALAGVKLSLKLSNDIPAFEQSFSLGEFDIAYMNPYHAIVANTLQGYQPVLRDASKQLFGVIVVRKDSAIKHIQELDGKLVAMPAPNALGAALIPRAEFARKFKIAPYYSYVKSHDSVYLNTLLGEVDAGGGVMGTLKKQSKDVRDHLRVLYETEKVARHPIVVHPDMPEPIRESIITSFIKLTENDEGRALLQKVPMSSVDRTSLEDYQVLHEMGLEAFYVRK